MGYCVYKNDRRFGDQQQWAHWTSALSIDQRFENIYVLYSTIHWAWSHRHDCLAYIHQISSRLWKSESARLHMRLCKHFFQRGSGGAYIERNSAWITGNLNLALRGATSLTKKRTERDPELNSRQWKRTIAADFPPVRSHSRNFCVGVTWNSRLSVYTAIAARKSQTKLNLLWAV